MLILILAATSTTAQESTENPPSNPTLVTLNSGIAYYALRDEVISREKYSGSVVPFEIIWNQSRPKYAWQFNLLYKQGTPKNYHTQANIRELFLTWDYQYRLPKATLLNRQLTSTVGPSPEIMLHFRQQRIAEFTTALYSFAMLISVGANSKLVYELAPRFHLENFNRLSLFAVGLRMTDFRDNENDDKLIKPLTPFNGVNFRNDLGVRYWLTAMFSVKLTYSWNITRISAWDYFLSSNDNLKLAFSILF